MEDEGGACPEDEMGDHETGPFCAHWSYLGDCEETCSKCGHSCGQHDNGGGECDDCECDKFVSADDDDTRAPESMFVPRGW